MQPQDGVVTVVLGPRGAGDLGQELATISGIEVICARDKQEVVDALGAGAQVLVSFDWDPSYAASGLRWIQGRGIGFDRFPYDDLCRDGVTLTTGAGVHNTVVAEHAFALLLALLRGLPSSVRSAEQSQWNFSVGHEFAGSTIALLGTGDIGQAFAARCAGWGVRLIGVTRDPDKYAHLVACGAFQELLPLSELKRACTKADALVVAVPKPPDGKPVVQAAHLNALAGGWLIDVSRGGVVDEDALLSALRQGVLTGAGRDVFVEEPLPSDSPFWSAPNLLITPHKAGTTVNYDQRFLPLFKHNLEAFRGGGKSQWANIVVDGTIHNKWQG